MRKIQINIKMDMFGDQAADGKQDTIYVYADANNKSEAICAAFQELMNTLERKRNYELQQAGYKEGYGAEDISFGAIKKNLYKKENEES